MNCPRCAVSLDSVISVDGVLHNCPRCHGLAIGMSVFRKRVGDARASEAWRQLTAKLRPLDDPLPCPICGLACGQVGLAHESSEVLIDLCQACQFLWLDPGELEAFPRGVRTPLMAQGEPPRPRGSSVEANEEENWLGALDQVTNVADWLCSLLGD